jgi:hypothetical protein
VVSEGREERPGVTMDTFSVLRLASVFLPACMKVSGSRNSSVVFEEAEKRYANDMQILHVCVCITARDVLDMSLLA